MIERERLKELILLQTFDVRGEKVCPASVTPSLVLRDRGDRTGENVDAYEGFNHSLDPFPNVTHSPLPDLSHYPSSP